jgi:hypothetical protein
VICSTCYLTIPSNRESNHAEYHATVTAALDAATRSLEEITLTPTIEETPAETPLPTTTQDEAYWRETIANEIAAAAASGPGRRPRSRDGLMDAAQIARGRRG